MMHSRTVQIWVGLFVVAGMAALARVGQVHIDLGHDAGGPLAEDQHAVGQEEGLFHIVGDQQHGAPFGGQFLNDADDFVPEVLMQIH